MNSRCNLPSKKPCVITPTVFIVPPNLVPVKTQKEAASPTQERPGWSLLIAAEINGWAFLSLPDLPTAFRGAAFPRQPA